MARSSPLAVIQRDLLDGVATTRILQNCIVLGADSGSTALRTWARRELDGYTDTDDEIPIYRKVTATICIDGQSGPGLITGQAIGPEDLPDFVRDAGVDNTIRLPMGVGELEALANSEKTDAIRLSLPQATIIVKAMNRELGDGFQSVHAVYWKLQRETIRGVVDRVRTALADLIADLVQASPDGQAAPPREAVDHAVKVAVTGNHATITLTNASASGEHRYRRLCRPARGRVMVEAAAEEGRGRHHNRRRRRDRRHPELATCLPVAVASRSVYRALIGGGLSDQRHLSVSSGSWLMGCRLGAGGSGL